jgi:para-nitrobenzyl esterase
VAAALRAATSDVLALTSPGQADNILEGTVLPVSPADAVAAGDYTNVPLLVGLVRDESKTGMQSYYQINDQTLFGMMYDFDPNNPTAPGSATLAAILKPDVTVEAYNTAAAEATAANAASWSAEVLNLFAPKQPKTYAYLWTWAQGPDPWKTLFGSGHGMDVAFIYGNFGKGMYSIVYTDENKAGREALSDAMMRSIGAFMRTGDPNDPSLGTTWAPWTKAAPRRLLLDATLTEKKISME